MSEFDNKQNESGGIFDEPVIRSKKLDAKQKHKNDMKKQITFMAICLAVVLAGVLFIQFVLPMFNEAGGEEIVEKTPVLLDGEVLGPQNRIFIMNELDRDEIASVDVHNEYGEWGIYYDSADKVFYMKDYKSAPYNQEQVERLLATVGFPLAMERITDNAEDLSEYGLSELNTPAWVEIKEKNTGKVHRLYIGDMLPSNSGYYVRYEGRNAVYVLDSTIKDTVLSPIEAMISPYLSFPVKSNDYHTIDDFALYKDNETVVAFDYMSDQLREQNSTTILHKLIYPAGYTPNDGNYLGVFQKFTNFKGESTLVYNPSSDDMKEYGLNTPRYVVQFKYKELPNEIWFSAANEKGNYYAYAPAFDLICEVSSAQADFLEWDILKWIIRSIFQEDIKTVKEIKLEGKDAKFDFVLSHENGVLATVEEKISGKKDIDTELFRKFYLSLLMTNLQDYAGLDDAAKSDLVSGTEAVKLEVVFTDGNVRTYKFYPYDTRKSFYTVDALGDFYIKYDSMVKIMSDAERVLSGEEIYPDANS